MVCSVALFAYVARFALSLGGKLFVLYLSEIRPFRADQRVFLEHCPLHENLIWEEKGKPWTLYSIRKPFKKPTLKYLGVGLSSKICRPMMAAIEKNVRDMQIPTSDSPGAHNLEDAWELQAGHSMSCDTIVYRYLHLAIHPSYLITRTASYLVPSEGFAEA